ncbi:hypothetical protein X805_27430 [Sphaerotilus natans subsp. natans DSM 6575]|uniref:Uncharacterized protein n=1 Tax=Sphaerotilus natans subsp. natans DSM 6575 TaxID=1286631 RepID=A0A059KJK2_9BURK|nr:hypothetical protein X805_27430 [Sphaerotilus natans subsp. natans DSM 6575]
MRGGQMQGHRQASQAGSDDHDRQRIRFGSERIGRHAGARYEIKARMIG